MNPCTKSHSSSSYMYLINSFSKRAGLFLQTIRGDRRSSSSLPTNPNPPWSSAVPWHTLWKTRVSLSGVLFSWFPMLSLCMRVCDEPCRGQRVQRLPLGLLWKTQLLAQLSGCESQKVDAQKQRGGGSTLSLDSRSFSRALRASTNLSTHTGRLSATLCRRFSSSPGHSTYV